jgi:hypothetical protein
MPVLLCHFPVLWCQCKFPRWWSGSHTHGRSSSVLPCCVWTLLSFCVRPCQATVSGGGNCACSGGSCGSCTGGDAQGSSGNIAGLASAVQAAVASQCAPNTLALCVSGTGSGGWDSNWCEYGAGFGLSFQASVTFNSKGELVEDELEGSASGSGSGYPPTLLCAVDPQALTINSAITMCSSECYGTPDFNACYCPCFSSFLSANGVAWASNISC